MVAQAYNPSAQEAEAGGFFSYKLKVGALDCAFEASLGYKVRAYLKRKDR